MEAVILILYACCALLISLEVIWDRKLYTLKDSLQNVGLASLYGILFFGVQLVLTRVDGSTTAEISLRNFVTLFIGYDFCYYWIHRSEHKVALIWKSSHIHHHSSRHLNFLTGFRSSYLQPFYMLPFLIPLYLMGFKTAEVFAMVTLNKLYNFWVHSQHVGKLPLMDKFLNTPSNHRVHHGRNAFYKDKNFGGVFILWDKLFGTYQSETEKVILGVEIDPETLDTKDFLLMGFGSPASQDR